MGSYIPTDGERLDDYEDKIERTITVLEHITDVLEELNDRIRKIERVQTDIIAWVKDIEMAQIDADTRITKNRTSIGPSNDNDD